MCKNDKKVEKPVRATAVAGSFYPSKREELQNLVENLLTQAKTFPKRDVHAIIVPHAGYIFSGEVAATAYKTLHKKYKNIFLIGSSHHIDFNGVSLYNKGDYQTPLGRVKVNQEIVQNLISKSSKLSFNEDAHKKEHTLEVQLPFLQTIYKDDFQIVPIIVASSEIATFQSLANALEAYFNEENLFVISSDLSHYPTYDDAYRVDMHLLDSLKKNSPLAFLEAKVQNSDADIENLQTSACGWGSLLTLLYLTTNREYTYELLEYKNSGDTKFGEKDRVVGYGAVRVFKNTHFTLNEEEKKSLKEIAKLALYKAVIENERVVIDETITDKKLLQHLGAFVTLYYKGELRGCIGNFEPDRELYKTVIEMAISASRFDKRFEPIKKEELQDVEIEVSVLTPRKRIYSLDEIKVGRDGIFVEYGQKSGTYLPHVATQMQWNAEEFVQSCCEEKAGIEANNCKNAKLYTYEAIVF